MKIKDHLKNIGIEKKYADIPQEILEYESLYTEEYTSYKEVNTDEENVLILKNEKDQMYCKIDFNEEILEEYNMFPQENGHPLYIGYGGIDFKGVEILS